LRAPKRTSLNDEVDRRLSPRDEKTMPKTRSVTAALIGAALALLPGVALADLGESDEPYAGRVDPDYAAGKKAVEAKDWKTAIKALSSAALRDTRNADIQNYLGYAYRNAGELDLAFKHYERALELNPRHRGAHEYIGEAYLIANNVAKAEEHLAALQKICLIPCEEYDDLRKKIAEHRSRASR
jgi:tetratricopeptide (TPR) repeat protein